MDTSIYYYDTIPIYFYGVNNEFDKKEIMIKITKSFKNHLELYEDKKELVNEIHVYNDFNDVVTDGNGSFEYNGKILNIYINDLNIKSIEDTLCHELIHAKFYYENYLYVSENRNNSFVLINEYYAFKYTYQFIIDSQGEEYLQENEIVEALKKFFEYSLMYSKEEILSDERKKDLCYNLSMSLALSDILKNYYKLEISYNKIYMSLLDLISKSFIIDEKFIKECSKLINNYFQYLKKVSVENLSEINKR